MERAAALGVTVTVARCHWNNFAGSIPAWTELRRRHPGLGFKWDPTHGYADGLDYVHELSACAPWVTHFHAKDMQIIGTQIYEDPPPGMGDIHWGKLMSILYHAGYQGAISYELHSKLWVVDRRYDGILLAQRYLSQFLV